MGRYAENTSVGIDKSKAEIERSLERYGATKFLHGWDQERAVIAFEMRGRRVQFALPLPRRDADEFRYTPARGYERSDADARRAWEQACRQRWRALALVIKAKLEAVEAGIVTFESEFLAHTLLPSGETVGQWIEPQIERAYRTGAMPPLLPPARPEGA